MLRHREYAMIIIMPYQVVSVNSQQTVRFRYLHEYSEHAFYFKFQIYGYRLFLIDIPSSSLIICCYRVIPQWLIRAGLLESGGLIKNINYLLRRLNAQKVKNYILQLYTTNVYKLISVFRRFGITII